MSRLIARPLRGVVSLLFAVLCLSATLPNAQAAATMNLFSAEQLYRQANALYQQQRYGDARNLYAQIIDAGVVSPDVYYNMGNAAARLGRTGEAVLNYERARALAPRDSDVYANLKKVAPANNDPQHFILVRPFFWIVALFSLREWMGGFFLCFLLAGATGALYFAVPLRGYTPWLRRALYSLGALSLAIGVFAGTKLYEDENVRYSVVMKSNAPIYSGPGEKFRQLLSAPEGTKIRRLSFPDPTWAQVVLMDGQPGFTLADNLRSI